jgi:hypothetical protein
VLSPAPLSSTLVSQLPYLRLWRSRRREASHPTRAIGLGLVAPFLVWTIRCSGYYTTDLRKQLADGTFPADLPLYGETVWKRRHDTI